MGRKNGKGRPFRYCSENGDARMGFPKTLSQQGQENRSPEARSAQRRQQRRKYGIGKLALQEPQSARPLRRCRELKVRAPTQFLREGRASAGRNASEIIDKVDPIVTPVFSTPRPTSKMLGIRSPLPFRQPELPSLDGLETPRASQRDGHVHGSLSADGEPITGERTVFVSPSPNIFRPASTIWKTPLRRQPIQSEGRATEDCQEQDSCGSSPSPYAHSGGLLSNHVELTLESVPLEASICDGPHTLHPAIVSRDGLGASSEEVRLAKDLSRKKGYEGTPTRMLLFKDGRYAVQRFSPSRLESSRRQDQAQEQETRLHRNEDASRSAVGGRSAQARKIQSSGLGKTVRKRNEETGDETDEKNKELPDHVEHKPCSPRRRPRPPKDASCILRQRSNGHGLVIEETPASVVNLGSTRVALGDRRVCQQARSPFLMCAGTETEESSEDEERSLELQSPDFEDEGAFASLKFSMSQAEEADDTFEIFPKTLDPGASSGLQVDRCQMFPDNCAKLPPRIAALHGDSDGDCVTVPPSPEQYRLDVRKNSECARETVLCQPMLVKVPAGALRSPSIADDGSLSTP